MLKLNTDLFISVLNTMFRKKVKISAPNRTAVGLYQNCVYKVVHILNVVIQVMTPNCDMVVELIWD